MRDQHPEDEAFWEWHTGESPHQPCPKCGWHIDFDPFDFKLCAECEQERMRLVLLLGQGEGEPFERGVVAEWEASGLLEAS